MDVELLDRGAVGGRDVGDEHVWEGRVGAGDEVEVGGLGAVEAGLELGGGDLGDDVTSLLSAAGDYDGRAVHVHLPVAHVIEPGPGERVVSCSDTIRDGILEGRRIHRGGVFAEVAWGGVGAPTLDRVDHHPFAALGGLEVFGEGDLAGSATVRSAALELQGLLSTDGHGRGGFRSIVAAGADLAGKVRAGSVKGKVVEGLGAVWGRVGHLHVGRGRGREGHCKEDGLSERHGC